MYKSLFISGLLLVFSLFYSHQVTAQNNKRGFKLLEKAEYDKAAELFKESKSENGNNQASLLGLMLIFADDSSSHFDLVTAWKYAVELKNKMENFTAEELEYIGEYFYNTETRHISRPVKKKIEYAVETVEGKLIKYVREENNLELVYKVLKEFPDFRYYDNVLHIRNQLEFRKYEKQNTLEAYLEFIKKFPDAAQIDKAVRYRNKIAFDNACKINTVEAYNAYIEQYPESEEMNIAIKNLHAVAFQEAKKANSIQAMDAFINEYPHALEIFDARKIQKQLLYEYAKKIQTLQAYNEFIRKYPEGQQYIDIFNLKSLDNGMRFLTAHPISGNNIAWARSFEEEANEELNACIAVDTLNGYIIGATVFRNDTGYTDAWIIRLNAEGKMEWNKYIGEGFNDEVSYLTINKKNEIIGAGYTWLGTDSITREPWLFKLGKDGTKMWSRKLGRMHINCLMTASNGNIFLGGFVVNDSLKNLYSVVVLNENGKRLWGRTYTGNGEIAGIEETSDGKLLLTGNRWSAKIDTRGYLLWEKTFNQNDSIVASIISKSEIDYLAVRDSVKLVLIRTGHDNKPLPEKNIMLPEVRFHVDRVIRGTANQIIALITFEQHQSVNWINALTGEINFSSRLPSGVNFQSITTDRKNNLLLEACNGEIILIKNNGITF